MTRPHITSFDPWERVHLRRCGARINVRLRRRGGVDTATGYHEKAARKRLKAARFRARIDVKLRRRGDSRQ